MQRLLIIILFMIVVIISMSVLSYYYITSVSSDLSDSLDKLKKHVNNENWEKAQNSYEEVEKHWGKAQNYFPLVVAHANLHELKVSITKVSTLVKLEEKKDIIPELEIAKKTAQEISEEETLSLSNIF